MSAPSFLDRARLALLRTRVSMGEQAFSAALSASNDAGVRAALSPLADDERFVAMIAVGLLRPDRLLVAAQAFLDGRSAERPFAWRDTASWAAVHRFLRAGMPVLDLDRTLAILEGESLEVASAERLRFGDIAGARRLHAAIEPLRKRERAEALARIAVATREEADFIAAEREAVGGPQLQHGAHTGGAAETEALAGVLSVYATTLAADHAAVVRVVGALVQRGRTYRKGQDEDLVLAASACAQAALPGQEAFLTHARAIQDVLVRGRENVEAAITAAGRRLAGEIVTPVAPEVASGPFDRSALAVAAREPSFAWRAQRAGDLAVAALEAGDAAAAEAAFRVAFSAPVEPPSPEERVRFAAARWAAGEPAGEALVELARHSSDGASFPDEAWALVEARLEGEALATFARVALARGMQMRGVGDLFERRSRAESLIRAVEARGSASLAREVLAAILAEPVPEASVDQERRAMRRQTAVAGLAPRLAPDPVEAAAAAMALLGEDQALLSYAPTLSAALAGPAGSGTRADAAELAVGAAREGRWEEALKQGAGASAVTLRNLASLSPPHAVAKKLVAAYKKTPKGRGDDAIVWKHDHAVFLLSLGEVDAALEIASTLTKPRVSGVGPGALATSIAEHLDERGGWDATRAAALVAVLTSGRVTAQFLIDPVLAVLPRAWPHLADPEGTLPALRALLQRSPGDVAAVEMARALALARLRDARAPEAFAAAVDASESGAPSCLEPRHLLVPLAQYPDLPGWGDLFLRAARLLERNPSRTHTALRALIPQLSGRGKAGIVALARATWASGVEDRLRAHALALLATEVDDEDTLEILLSRAGSEVEVRQVVAAAACLAKRHRDPAADELAALIGLA